MNHQRWDINYIKYNMNITSMTLIYHQFRQRRGLDNFTRSYGTIDDFNDARTSFEMRQ